MKASGYGIPEASRGRASPRKRRNATKQRERALRLSANVEIPNPYAERSTPKANNHSWHNAEQRTNEGYFVCWAVERYRFAEGIDDCKSKQRASAMVICIGTFGDWKIRAHTTL